MEIRNIAIIAHVDHGKTTLVDKMIEAGNVENERERLTGDLIMEHQQEQLTNQFQSYFQFM